MKVKKGQLVLVNHSRSGTWHGIATEDFDTVKDEWYSLNLVSESTEGLNTIWVEGDRMPARRGLCSVTIKEKKKKMNDKEIYDSVEKEIDLMILETYHGVPMRTDIRSKAMVFARRAIRKTIDYKNSQTKGKEKKKK